jgi:N-acetylneuraminate synthase
MNRDASLHRPDAATYVIAEAGVNHNGALDRAKRLVDVAAEAGADAVKFQTFRAEALTVDAAEKAAYQQDTTDAEQSQRAMLRALELPPSFHESLVEHCAERGLPFLSSPFDPASVDLLVDDFDVPRIKIPSGELTNAPLLLHIARTGRPALLSTGMSTLGEVEEALGVLAFGYRATDEAPGPDAFRAAYASDRGQDMLRDHVVLLQCTSAYPAPVDEVNLRAMGTLRSAFGLPVGLSDHTRGTAVPVAAVARGARVVEKHVTLDRSLPGPDHRASLEPDELAAMVDRIRTVERALGSARKRPTPSERKNRPVARKSLVAAQPIAEGEPFTEENLTAKRPGTGLAPTRYWDYLGRTAARDYDTDDLIEA